MERLLDKIAGRFGYVRQDISKPVLGTLLPDILRIPPHLEAEDTFRYGLVQDKTDWASFYNDTDGLHFAIGSADWMPILMAGFVLGYNQNAGMKLFSEAIAERLWLQPSSPVHASWLAANEGVVQQIEQADAIEIAALPDCEETDIFVPAMFVQFSASIVSMELRTMWRRCHPRQPTLLCTTHAHAMLSRTDMMQQARIAPQVAMTQLLEWTADWFAARGFAVDRERMLIHVPGYQPLFHFDSEPGAY